MKLQITSEISHVKGFDMKLQFTSEISHLKRFHMKLQAKFHIRKDKVIRISFSHEITNYKVKFYMCVKRFHMKL